MNYKKNTKAVDQLVSIYRKLISHPNATSGWISSKGSQTTSELFAVHSSWSLRCPVRGNMCQFRNTHLLNSDLSTAIIDFPPTDTSSELLFKWSHTEKSYSVIRQLTDFSSTANSKKMYLEVWDDSRLSKTIDLGALDIHGDVYVDVEFGTLEWSPDDQKIVYLAEKKKPKTEPFYPKKGISEELPGKPTPVPGEEYLFKEDWGEQLVGKQEPSIFIFDINTESISEIKAGVPKDMSPAQLIWSADGSALYGVALYNEPRKLGLIYCANRKAVIFRLEINSGKFEILSADGKFVKSPRLSPDGNSLVWLQRPFGGPHDGCHELISYDIRTKKSKVLIPITNSNNSFLGIYVHALPPRCFSSDQKIFFSTIRNNLNVSYSYNLVTDTLSAIDLAEQHSTTVLDVVNDLVLMSNSSVSTTPKLCLFKTNGLLLRDITKDETLPNIRSYLINITGNNISPAYNYILMMPSEGQDKFPLVVFCHGGPHAAYVSTYMLDPAFFVSLGMAVLMVNYRGSTGAGQDSVEDLPGKIGTLDVQDIQYALNHALEQNPTLDREKIVVYGGSHGGFLTAHLSGQFPDIYKAAVLRNPVIDTVSMIAITDIPDWCACQGGFPYRPTEDLTMEMIEKLYVASPMRHASKVKCPTLLLIGKSDLRVPPSQGFLYYHALKARGVDVKLHLYEDNHPLGKVPNHLDSLINAGLWFLDSLNINIK